MNGKVTSNVGQRVALWPVFPHEKHFTSDQSRLPGRGRDCWLSDCFPLKNVRSIVSNFIGSAGAGGAGGTGWVLANFPISSCNNLSIADGSGALAGALTTGVNIVTNFLSSSLP